MRPRVRPLTAEDTEASLALYISLTRGPKQVSADAFLSVLAHPGTTVFGAEGAGTILGMVTLHILPNVTWGGRPYGLIENVVTHPDHRNRGIGRAVMNTALTHAWSVDAYKVMVMTGKARDAKGFYEAVGFSAEDKYAFVLRSVGPD